MDNKSKCTSFVYRANNKPELSDGGLSVRNYGQALSTPDDGSMAVDISYLRSDISRGSEQSDYQFSILFGNGYHNTRDARLDAVSTEFDQESGENELVWRNNTSSMLVQYNRRRAVAQAVARICRDKSHKVVLLAGKYSYSDLPPYMRNRVVFVNEILETQPDETCADYNNGEPKRQWQIDTIAEWVAQFIKGDSYNRDPAPYDWMHIYTPEMAADAFDKVVNNGNKKKICRLIWEEMGRDHEVQKSAHRGMAGWIELIDNLCEIGVLRKDLGQCAHNQFVAISGPYYRLLEDLLSE
ncbi:MAG TPA: hypothetical protein DCL60_12415 [Armatimonadetes bacterium]|nr:hypothetical protein [Armatimonadota bacterium]